MILATSHGRRSIDVLQIYEPKLANWEYVNSVESQIPKEFGADAVEIPGARALLDELNQRSVPWAIVTSGSRPLVSGWLDVLNLAHPKNLVTAEDVKHGKPGMLAQTSREYALQCLLINRPCLFRSGQDQIESFPRQTVNHGV